MAQIQYTNYQADILSYPLRDALVGILKPGRYIGYDLMQEYSPQLGDNVYCEVKNDEGQNKYDGDGVDPPTLEAERGIAITTQGTIIADDLTTPLQVTVPLINGGAISGVFHIVYMEHIYDDANPGANAASYGIISGSDNATMPVLTSPTKRVIIGIIWEPIGASQFSNLVWYSAPPKIGDGNILENLFKMDAQGIRINRGTIPANGIIGDRYFNVAPDYITNYKSITEVLYELDVAIAARAGDITTLQGTKLDDWTTPDDNTDLNVTSSYHGLMPKLPSQDGDVKVLNGLGSWVIPPWARIEMRTGTFGYDFQFVYTDLEPADPDTGSIDFSGVGGLPGDADVLILSIQLQTDTDILAGIIAGIGFRVASTGSLNANAYHPSVEVSSPSASLYSYFQLHVPCTSGQLVYYSLINKAYLVNINISVVGWQTYAP